MRSEALTARIESRNGIASMVLVGELDIATVPAVEDHFARLEREGASGIVIDLRELAFLDCSGVHAFVTARERAEANGHRLILVGATQPARRLFELTRTGFLLDEGDAVDVLDRFTGGQTHRRAGQVGSPT